jgi:hypothetical protein
MYRLGLVPFFDPATNTTRNDTNIIGGSKTLSGIFYDSSPDANMTHRFVAFSRGFTYVSSDGFAFQAVCRPLSKGDCVCGKSQIVPSCRHLNFSGPSQAYYDRSVQKYRVFFRTTRPRTDGVICPNGDPNNPSWPGTRSVGQLLVDDIFSPDWGAGDHSEFAPAYNTTIFGADSSDDPCLSVYSAQAMQIADMYAMAPLMFLNCNDTGGHPGDYPRHCSINPDTSPKLPAVNRKDRSDGLLESHFAVSRDGRNFTRLSREAWVPRGIGKPRSLNYPGVFDGSFDSGTTTVACGHYDVDNITTIFVESVSGAYLVQQNIREAC